MIKLQQQSNTLSSAIKDYLLYYRAKGVTDQSYNGKERELGKLLTLLGDSDLSSLDLMAYYASVMQLNIAINSKGTYLRSVKTFIRWCNKEYGLSLPLPDIPSEDVIKETYSDDDLKKLIAKPKTWKNFAEYRTWIITLLLIDTGMRAATVRNIRLEDINFDEKYIVSKHNKTKKQQLIPISPFLANEMKVYSRYTSDCEYFFPDQFGRQLSDGALKLSIKRYNLARGVTITSIHAHRHTFAKRFLLEMNGDPLRLQRLLGHSTLAMTQHYARIYDRELLKVYENTSPLELLKNHKIVIK